MLGHRLPGDRFRGDDRAVNNMVGALLMITIFLAFAAGMVLTVQATIDEDGGKAQLTAVENEFEVLAAEMESVTAGASPERELDLQTSGADTEGHATVRPDAGHVTVDVSGVGGGPELETDLGAVVFERDDGRVAVQNGGVWRRSPRNGPSMVDAPSMVRVTPGPRPSVSLSVVQIRSARSEGSTLDGTVFVSKAGQQDEYPGLFVPASSTLTITVESEYAEAWARYFRERFPDGTTTVTYSAGDPGTVEVVYDPSDGFYLHFARHTVEVDNR